jgi:pyruvate/2-oxoglutarate dehydrogenase complex dihydrolipoamide dehydrogenase (E3) component
MAKDIVVIGGGPAGVEAALSAAPHAKSVRLVADAPIGDWYQLMPSRVWLTVLDQIASQSIPPLVSPRQPIKADAFDLNAVAVQIDRVAASWSGHIATQLQERNVETITGRASFKAPGQISVDGCSPQILHADATLIATGSVPFFPSGLEPDGLKIFSPDTADRFKSLPRSILVIGDSCIGFEFVDIFTRLGVQVTWIVLPGGPISGFGAEVDALLLDIFRHRIPNHNSLEIKAGPPVILKHGKTITAVRQDGARFEAEAAFVTIGQRPNLAPLNLGAAGLETNPQGLLETDAWGQTRTPGIYAIGGALRFGPGNFALAQARAAALHATGQKAAAFDPDSTIVWFGLNPQAAKVGVVANPDSAHSALAPYKANLAAHINDDLAGFVRVGWNDEGIVTGGVAAGRQAAEALAPVALAVKLGAHLEDLAQMQGAHPTLGELSYIAARAAQRQY